MGDDVLSDAALVIEVKVLKVFRAGKRAAAMRFSPPWDWREDTSRSKQAARKSSWLQASVRARSASVPPRPRARGLSARGTNRRDRASSSCRTGDAVIDGQAADLDIFTGGLGASLSVGPLPGPVMDRVVMVTWLASTARGCHHLFAPR